MDLISAGDYPKNAENDPFPVDIVYTWVNDMDSDWQRLYQESLKNGRLPAKLHKSVNDSARFKNRNEIYYSILSVKRYAPWIRHIYIVTNCKLPDWAEADPLISAVSHEQIFECHGDLPTFNAFAIEACLHKVPGLSEHFIYFNDDVFLLQPVKPLDFFPTQHAVSVFPTKHDIPESYTDNLRPVEYSMLNTCRILKKQFGYNPIKKLHHAPFPILKSVMLKIESEYLAQLRLTRSHPFRESEDLPLATTLHAYYCAATGRAVFKNVMARYIDIGNPLFIFLILPFSPLLRGKYQFLCLNEITSLKWFSQVRDAIVSKLMKHLFIESENFFEKPLRFKSR